MNPDDANQRIAFCASADLQEGARAVPFDVVYVACETCGCVDDAGRWWRCATHGAVYAPDTGECAGGPCRGGLVKIDLSETDGVVHWHTAYNLKPFEFPL